MDDIRKEIQKILNKRNWDMKDWHRAAGLKQAFLETLMNADINSFDAEQIKTLNSVYELTVNAKKPSMLRFKKPIIIACWAYKGGIGKTTIAINLGFELARRGYNVLNIDTDGQSDMSSILKPNYLENPEVNFHNAFSLHQDFVEGNFICNTDYDNLDIIPGNGRSEDLENILSVLKDDQRQIVLNMCFKTIMLQNYYDFIIIDKDKSAGLFTSTLLSKADYVIPPIEPEQFSIKSIPTVIEHVNAAKKANSNLTILGLVLNKFDNRKKTAMAESIRLINKLAPNLLFETHIKCDSNIGNSQKSFIPLGVYNKSCSANKQMVDLTDEVLKRIKNNQNERL